MNKIKKTNWQTKKSVNSQNHRLEELKDDTEKKSVKSVQSEKSVIQTNWQTKNSIFWDLSVKQAWDHPYEYKEKILFLKEAERLLCFIYEEYNKFNLKFHIDDKSLKKAVWMLHLDAIDTLKDCLYLLENKKHRLVGKMFRDVKETLDIALLFIAEPKYKKDWFENEKTPKHMKFRNLIKEKHGDYQESILHDEYQRLSKWTHHGYFNLKHSFSLGVNDLMVYESYAPEILVLPQTISIYIVELKNLILQIEKDYKEFIKL